MSDQSPTNQSKSRTGLVAIGLAMFSMFFGSGNIVFPVMVGQLAQEQASFAMLGLLVTAVGVPLFGLITMALYDGDYMAFFKRLGHYPGWTIVVLTMALVGPLAVIPRCVVISHSTVATFFPSVSLPLFSIVSCLIIYFCTYKQRRVVEVLGLYLTPVLLLALAAIIVRGLTLEAAPAAAAAPNALAFDPYSAMLMGLQEGYNTMDLFAAFLFSGVVLTSVKKAYGGATLAPRKLTLINLKASLIGMGLLTAIYWGMCTVAARHGGSLLGVTSDRLLSQLTLKMLGPFAGIVVCVAVSLACLTTAISLALVFTQFLCRDLTAGRLKYRPTLFVSLSVACVVSTLQFTGIQAILVPVLKLSLPALMMLTLVNFLHKFAGFKFVRLPVVLTFVVTALYQFGS